MTGVKRLYIQDSEIDVDKITSFSTNMYVGNDFVLSIFVHGGVFDFHYKTMEGMMFDVHRVYVTYFQKRGKDIPENQSFVFPDIEDLQELDRNKPCGNKTCGFYDNKYEQNCAGEKGDDSAVVTCFKFVEECKDIDEY